MPTKTSLKETKLAYIELLETYVEFGYDISKMLHPNYNNIDAARCNEIIQNLKNYNN